MQAAFIDHAGCFGYVPSWSTDYSQDDPCISGSRGNRNVISDHVTGNNSKLKKKRNNMEQNTSAVHLLRKHCLEEKYRC
jgi:hypothetical protein